MKVVEAWKKEVHVLRCILIHTRWKVTQHPIHMDMV